MGFRLDWDRDWIEFGTGLGIDAIITQTCLGGRPGIGLGLGLDLG